VSAAELADRATAALELGAGHSLNVWTRFYARSFGKAQRDEARARMLGHGFGADLAPEKPASEGDDRDAARHR